MKRKNNIISVFLLGVVFSFHLYAVEPITFLAFKTGAEATAASKATSALLAAMQLAAPPVAQAITVFKGANFLCNHQFFFKDLKKFFSSSRNEIFYHKVCAQWTVAKFQAAFAQRLGKDVRIPDCDASLYEHQAFKTFDSKAISTIFKQYSLYQYEAFRQYLKTLPHCEKHITRIWKSFQKEGIKEPYEGFKDHLNSLYKPLELKKIAEQKIAHLQKQQARIQQAFQNNKEYIQELQSDYDEYIQSVHEGDVLQRVQNRQDALQSMFFENESFTEKRFKLSYQTRRFLQSHDINPKMLSMFYGNQFQAVLHKEFVDITEQTAKIWKDHGDIQSVKIMAGALSDFILGGIGYNKIGKVHKASLLADCCWAVLEGVGDGIFNTVDAVLHPIDTISDVAQGLKTAGYYLGKALYEIGEMYRLSLIDEAACAHTLIGWIDNVESVCEAIQTQYKNVTLAEAIRPATSFATECVLTGKVLSGAGKIFTYIKANKVKYLKYMKDASKSRPVALTAEGIPFQLADGAMEYIKCASKILPNLNDNFIIKKIIIDIQKSNVIKKFNIIQKMIKHTFSDKHLAAGIMKLGKDEISILNKFAKIIKIADYKGLVKVGQNQIYTTIKGYNVTIRFFVNEGEVLMMNGFMKHAMRRIGNTFKL